MLIPPLIGGLQRLIFIRNELILEVWLKGPLRSLFYAHYG